MKKIVIMMALLIGLVASCFATTVFVEEDKCDDGLVFYDYYDTNYGLCRTSNDPLSEKLETLIICLKQPVFISINSYEEIDTFMFAEKEYDYYWFWNNEDTELCFVFPLDEKRVLYMWFAENGK